METDKKFKTKFHPSSNEWVKVDWPYDGGYAKKVDCYYRTITGRNVSRNVYLTVQKDNPVKEPYSYTVEQEFSGCCPDATSLEEAKKYIESYVPGRL